MPADDLDLFADENEPKAEYAWTTYKLTVPRLRQTLPTKEIPFVYVDVDEYGLVNINGKYTLWFGSNVDLRGHSKSGYQLQREIMDWLVEWEYAEWRRIGPEDSELFATKKLTGKDYD